MLSTPYVLGKLITSFVSGEARQNISDHCRDLPLSPPITTIMPYANSLDLDEMPSNLTSHPNTNCLMLRLTLSDIEAV